MANGSPSTEIPTDVPGSARRHGRPAQFTGASKHGKSLSEYGGVLIKPSSP